MPEFQQGARSTMQALNLQPYGGPMPVVLALVVGALAVLASDGRSADREFRVYIGYRLPDDPNQTDTAHQLEANKMNARNFCNEGCKDITCRQDCERAFRRGIRGIPSIRFQLALCPREDCQEVTVVVDSLPDGDETDPDLDRRFDQLEPGRFTATGLYCVIQPAVGGVSFHDEQDGTNVDLPNLRERLSKLIVQQLGWSAPRLSVETAAAGVDLDFAESLAGPSKVIDLGNGKSILVQISARGAGDELTDQVWVIDANKAYDVRWAPFDLHKAGKHSFGLGVGRVTLSFEYTADDMMLRLQSGKTRQKISINDLYRLRADYVLERAGALGDQFYVGAQATDKAQGGGLGGLTIWDRTLLDAYRRGEIGDPLRLRPRFLYVLGLTKEMALDGKTYEAVLDRKMSGGAAWVFKQKAGARSIQSPR